MYATDVPSGATVVGVPGHIIDKDRGTDSEDQERRKAMAKKIGFDAYGGSKDMPDPVQNAINSMLDHMHKVEEELQSLKRKIDE